MGTTETEPEQEGGRFVTWSDFLSTYPPGKEAKVVGLYDYESGPGTGFIVQTPTIERYCDSKTCQDTRFFDGMRQTPDASIEDGEWHCTFLFYYCRHCRQSMKAIAVRVLLSLAQDGSGTAVKIGEWPAFGPWVPARVRKLIGPDWELFRKGQQSESQGQGMGAFTYYRRVVENQKNRLLDQIIKVAKRLHAGPELIQQLDAAKAEKQFSRAVDQIKDTFPDVLKIDGHNPLLLLHKALSQHIHEKTDEECLQLAQSVRLILAELADRIGQALKDHAELTKAVGQLLQDKAPRKPK